MSKTGVFIAINNNCSCIAQTAEREVLEETGIVAGRQAQCTIDHCMYIIYMYFYTFIIGLYRISVCVSFQTTSSHAHGFWPVGPLLHLSYEASLV